MTENPKHYAGAKKVPFGDVPAIVEAELSLAMYEGAIKYGSFNYRKDPIRAGDYYAAIRRHLTEWWELGEDADATCGISHLVKIMACCCVIRDAEITGMLIDDRPAPISRTQWDRIEKAAAEMRERLELSPRIDRVTTWPEPGDCQVPRGEG